VSYGGLFGGLFGLLFGLVGGLQKGGFAYLQHYALRFLLCRNDYGFLASFGESI
jgi:hypothetical protein